MTAGPCGLATRIQNVYYRGLIRVQCGLHPLDVVMQGVYSSALDDSFYLTLTMLIGQLRRQQNLISEMRSTCRKVANKCWLSMSKVALWLTVSHIRVKEYLDSKKPTCAPSASGWGFLFAMHAFSTKVSAVLTSLQGFSTVASEQKLRLYGLVDTYYRMSGMQGPLTPY